MFKIAALLVLLCLEHYKIFANGQIPSYVGPRPPEHEIMLQGPLPPSIHDIKIQQFDHPRNKDGGFRLDVINIPRKAPRRMNAPLNLHDRHPDRRDYNFHRNEEFRRNMYLNPQSSADSVSSGPEKYQTVNKIFSNNIPDFIAQTKFRNNVQRTLETNTITSETATIKNLISPSTLASTGKTISNVKNGLSNIMEKYEKVEINTAKAEHKKTSKEIPLQSFKEGIEQYTTELSEDEYYSTTDADDTTTFITDTTIYGIEDRSGGLSASVIGSLLGK